MEMKRQRAAGFTLIELLVVIVIIAILMGLAFPVFQGVQNQARKTQAKNDLTQIVTAVNAFYTEYGRYPTAATTDPAAVYESGSANNNNQVLIELLGKTGTINTRQVVFISPPNVKDDAKPRAGVTTAGRYYDPWGSPYAIALDADYDNEVTNPYGAGKGAGPDKIRQGVIAWSLGKNGALGGGNAASGNFANESGTANVFTSSGDVISWQ
jgi:prepilin-type N-terminal cleavage/methylation domain-containing protein